MGERRQRIRWAAVWDALTPAQRTTITEQCALLDVDPSLWSQVPAVRQPWALVAPVQLAVELRRELRCGDTAALVLACDRLGLNPDSFARLVRRTRAMLRFAAPDIVSGQETRSTPSRYDSAAFTRGSR